MFAFYVIKFHARTGMPLRSNKLDTAHLLLPNIHIFYLYQAMYNRI